jgi:hypothetical protein
VVHRISLDEIFHQSVHGVPVFNIGIVTLLPIGLFTLGRVENSGNMWFNGKTAIVTITFECPENLEDLCLAFARESILGGFGFTCGGISTILDMNVNDVLPDLLVKFKRVLPWKGLGLGAVELKNWVSGVEDQF